MSDRAVQIRRVIEQCMARRDAGEAVSDAEVITGHPELMPELERELRVLAVIERAVLAAHQKPPAPAESTPSPAAADASVIGVLGERLAGYQVLREVHRGSQGIVYHGVQQATGRRIAIKVRRDGFFGNPREVDRFRREVEIMAHLDHPNIVGVIDSGVKRGCFYYIMDFVDGVPLDQYVLGERPEIEPTLRLFAKIAEAVHAAHLRGVIHRDLKPANVLVDRYGEPHLLDFGLARLSSRDALSSSTGASGPLTQTGQFVGSLPWTSPEQVEGSASRVDLRTDIYALGVILFQMLTGKLPYEVESDLEAAALTIGQAVIPRPSRFRPGVGREIDAIVHTCLQKEPSMRYQSAGDLARDVQNAIEGRDVAAASSTRWGEVRAFARRNRVLIAANFALITLLLVAVVAMAIHIARAG